MQADFGTDLAGGGYVQADFGTDFAEGDMCKQTSAPAWLEKGIREQKEQRAEEKLTFSEKLWKTVENGG